MHVKNSIISPRKTLFFRLSGVLDKPHTFFSPKNQLAPVAGLDILVDEVRLEYWMELDGETGKGEIFPVWSFAGHTKTRYETGMEERISGQWVMLTADARDGNILQTWVQIN